MTFTEIVKEIVATSKNGITPPAIREVIKSFYPEYYATDRHKMHVARGNYTDLEHALLAQIYGATRTNRAFAIDKTKRPMVIHMAEGKHFVQLVSRLDDDVTTKKRLIPMVKLSIPAARVRQGDLLLYATSMKVREIMSSGFYSVETLDPEDTESKGYQRLLNRARARKLADYILKGQDSNDVFLPTSIFLATDKDIEFDEISNTLEIDSSVTGAFSVVDGQHRLEGLRMAMEKDERVLDFEVPVNIAVSLPKIAQMCHFLIVNTTQKSVDKSVEQRILARLTSALDIEEDLPSLPKWILNTVQKGEVDKAIKYADFLNDAETSPWYRKIHMANAEGDKSTVNQHSFVKAIVKYLLTANNPLQALNDFDKERRIFLNYWIAIASILDDGNSTTLYKYNGVELFCKFSIPFFMKLQDGASYTVPTMESLLQKCLDNVEGDYAGVSHPDWWKKGGQGSGLNAGAINHVFQAMVKGLHTTSMSSAIDI
jgi:DGQHR domain-containing protein